MIQEWTFNKSGNESFEKIAEFRKNFPPVPIKCCVPEYYRWKCLDNLTHQGHIWLAEANDKIVASASMTQKSMNILGKEVPAAETGDTYTLSEYQGKGIFTELVKRTTRESLDKKISFIYGLPNANSSPGYKKKLNYDVIPSVQLFSMYRPLNIKLALKQRFRNSLLATVLSPILEIISKIIFKVNAVAIGKKYFSVSESSTFPDDINSVWDCSSKNYDIILRRSKKYLVWRYITVPDSYIILNATNTNGEFLGYIVGKITDQQGYRTGSIADFLTIEDDANIFKRLALTLTDIFNENKVDTITTWVVKRSIYYRTLLKLGFRTGAQIPVICYKNKLGNQIIKGAYRWHFTLGDSDNI